jgi:hypothetical protein
MAEKKCCIFPRRVGGQTRYNDGQNKTEKLAKNKKGTYAKKRFVKKEM